MPLSQMLIRDKGKFPISESDFRMLFNQCVVAVKYACRRIVVITYISNLRPLVKRVSMCIIFVLSDMSFHKNDILTVF